MTLDATALRKLAGLGLSPDQMAGVLDVLASMTEAEEARKAAQRERTRKFREKIKAKDHVTLQSDYRNSDDTRASVTRIEDKPLPKEIEPQEQEERNARERASSPSEFAEFWSLYPHKVGKPVAEAKFAAARKIASFETIMAGLRTYVAKTDDRPWCNPATWLHQHRWGDQPAIVIPQARGRPPPRGNPILQSADRLLAEMRSGNGRERTDSGKPQALALAFRRDG